MEVLDEKYSKITLDMILLSMMCFPPMTIYLVYKMVRNSDIDYLDNYLSIKKCAKFLIGFPAFYTFLGLFILRDMGAKSYLSLVGVFWCYFGIFAIIFFIRAHKMKLYNEYFQELYANATTYEEPIQEESFEEYEEEEYIYEEEPSIQYKVVICNSCGAKKQIEVGRKVKCDYCDSPLEADLR